MTNKYSFNITIIYYQLSCKRFQRRLRFNVRSREYTIVDRIYDYANV